MREKSIINTNNIAIHEQNIRWFESADARRPATGATATLLTAGSIKAESPG